MIRLNNVTIGDAIYICTRRKDIDKLTGDGCADCPFLELIADDMYGCPVGHIASNVSWNSNPLIAFNRKGLKGAEEIKQ